MNRNRKFKQLYGRLDMVDLDRHEKYYGSLGLADPFTIETKQGNPILLDGTKERPFEGMRIFGKSTQDGTPSPDNPVPILSAGDSGEIEAKVYGGNLISSDISSWNKSGWGISNDDRVLQLSDGIKIKAINGWIKVYYDTSEMNGKTLNLSFDYRQIESETTSPITKHAFAVVVQDENVYPSSVSDIFPFRIRSPETVKTHVSVSFIARNYLCFFLRVNTEGEEAGETRAIEVTNIMLNAGNTELTYEPYKTPQSIVLSTPGGLPGIPVTSGGNYTDESGQQWVCDEIDLARRKYVQRIGHNANVNDWVRKPGNPDIESTTSRFALDIENIDNYIYSPCICNRLSYAKVDSYGTEGTYVTINETSSKCIFARIEGITSLEDFRAAMPDLEVIWLLETPIETDLPAEEIAAYKALHTYSPTTTVSNDAGAWMKVEYNEFNKRTF